MWDPSTRMKKDVRMNIFCVYMGRGFERVVGYGKSSTELVTDENEFYSFLLHSI
jgi:hypothetical protein